MFGDHSYHRTIRKLSVAFGSLFNDIKVVRFDNNGDVNQTIQVPLSYSPSHKWFARQIERSSIDNTVDGITSTRMILPRMGYTLDNVLYDAERAINRNHVMAKCGANGPTAWQNARVPFNINFTLSIMTKKTEDGLQILEQVLPYFTPSLTLPVVDMPDLQLESNIPVELEDISFEDTYEGGFEEPRELIWNLSFVMRAWLYFPTQPKDGDLSSKIIEKVTMNYRPYCDWDRQWTTVTVGGEECNLIPNSVDIYPSQTQTLDSFDISEQRTAKYLVLVEDPEAKVFKEMEQYLVTHNGVDTSYVTVYNQMGDNILHDVSTIIEDGVLKLQITNNEALPLQVKFIKLYIPEVIPNGE